MTSPAASIVRFSRTLFLLFLHLTIAVGLSAQNGDGAFWHLTPGSDPEALLAQMSEEEIVGQLFMVSWPGTQPSRKLLNWIEKRNIGGIKIFGWNARNLETMVSTISDMQTHAVEHRNGVPLLVATDQEGGWVRHVKGSTSITPGNMAIGASGLPYDAFQSAKIIGEELRTLGINMNFAPTVDVYVNPKADVIGPRSFSGNPVEVGTLGTAFFEGLRSVGVIATAKHFPGHGDASGDSHGMLPVIEGDFDLLWERDLVPYRIMIPEGLPAVMSGHLAFPGITETAVPASLSELFGHHVLREQLGFSGVTITDDLYMDGARIYGNAQGISFPELVLQALRAGNDMVLLSRTPELNGAIWRSVFSAYQNDRRFRKHVHRSVKRILRLKLEYLRPDDRVPLHPDPEAVRRELPNPNAEEFFTDQAARSVTVVRSRELPLSFSQDESVLLVGRDPSFLREGRSYFTNADTLQLRYSTAYRAAPEDSERFQRVGTKYDRIIYNLSSRSTLDILQSARALHGRVAVLSSLTPVYLQELPRIDTAVAVYGFGAASYRAGFAVLRGDFSADGRLPIYLSNEE